MAETTTHQMGVEDAAFDVEVTRMSAEADRLLDEMKQSQKEIERLREGNLARLSKIEATLSRILSS